MLGKKNAKIYLLLRPEGTELSFRLQFFFIFLVGSMCCAHLSPHARSISLSLGSKAEILHHFSLRVDYNARGRKNKTRNAKKNINIRPLVVDFFKNKEANNILRSNLLSVNCSP